MINVAEIMTRRPLVTIDPHANVAQATALIRDSGVSHLLVTDHGALLGVVCRCDLDEASELDAIANRMTHHPLCLEPGCSAAEAAALMRMEDVSLLPVVDRGEVVGVVGRRDLRAHGFQVDQLGEQAVCAACGSHQHVRADGPVHPVGFCLDCRHSSRPPQPDDELDELGAAG